MSEVVFVSEHGSAKSVLAATYFNRLAELHGLAAHACSRGTAPDPEVPGGVTEGLAAEGLVPCTLTPTELTPRDLGNADRVVTFDRTEVSAPTSRLRATPSSDWSNGWWPNSRPPVLPRPNEASAA